MHNKQSRCGKASRSSLKPKSMVMSAPCANGHGKANASFDPYDDGLPQLGKNGAHQNPFFLSCAWDSSDHNTL